MERYEGIGNKGHQFIYSLKELKELNKEFAVKDEFDIIFRKYDKDWETPFGIRADPYSQDPNGKPDGLAWTTCLWSLFVPWHADWLVTWIYIGFALYFWIETFLIMGHEK